MPEPNSGCVLWLGQTTEFGHGLLRWKGRAQVASRLAWEDANGPVPDGLFVCHRCDVPACINTRHLFLGTHVENMADMLAKGRHAGLRGEKIGTAKLTAEDVVSIRRQPHLSLKVMAERFGVSKTMVSLIRRRKAWAHLDV